MPTRDELLRSAQMALAQGNTELAKRFMDAADAVGPPPQQPPAYPRQSPPAYHPQPQPAYPPQFPPIQAPQKPPSNAGSKAVVVGILLFMVIGGAIGLFTLLGSGGLSRDGIPPIVPMITQEIKKVNPPNIVPLDWKGETKLGVLDVYAVSSLTLHNSGGSGYAVVEYYGSSSGTLARKVYYLHDGETSTFTEKLDITINDKSVSFRIVEQRAG